MLHRLMLFMIYRYDAVNDKCPLPLVKMRQILKKMTADDSFIITLSDKGSLTDIPNYLTTKGYIFSIKHLGDSVTELHIQQVR